MIVRTLSDAKPTQRHIVSPDGNWESTRLLLAEDKMGFSFHITTIFEGANFQMHYQNHLESVYCISGSGFVKTLDDDTTYPIEPGTLYILNKHDKHVLCAHQEMSLACVFNPPLHGKEVHNSEGAYELNAECIND